MFKKILIVVLTIALGVGIFFAVKYFFFNSPDLEKPFEIVNSVVEDESFKELEAMFSREEDNITATVVNYLDKYISDPAFETAEELQHKSELLYTYNRLENAIQLYDDCIDYIEYYNRCILYLESDGALKPLIKELENKRNAIKNAAKTTIEYVRNSVIKHFDGIEMPTEKNDVIRLTKYTNEMYLRNYVVNYIGFVGELSDFCVIASKILSYSENTMETNPYRLSLTFLMTNWTDLQVENLLKAPVSFARNSELIETDQSKYGADEYENLELYRLVRDEKFLKMSSDEILILDYDKKSTTTYPNTETVVISPIETSYRLLAEGLKKTDLKAFVTNITGIRKEIEERGSVDLPEDSEDDNFYLDPYLSSLPISESREIKLTFVRLVG